MTALLVPSATSHLGEICTELRNAVKPVVRKQMKVQQYAAEGQEKGHGWKATPGTHGSSSVCAVSARCDVLRVALVGLHTAEEDMTSLP